MRDFIKKVSILFTILFLSVPLGLASLRFGRGAADETEVIRVGDNTEIIQNGCYRKIKKSEKTEWTVPRKPIDLVILQDASGSFRETIPSVKRALKRLRLMLAQNNTMRQILISLRLTTLEQLTGSSLLLTKVWIRCVTLKTMILVVTLRTYILMRIRLEKTTPMAIVA